MSLTQFEKHSDAQRLQAHAELNVQVSANSGAVLKLSNSVHSLSFAAAITCVVLVALNLRPGIVSIGPLLPQIREEFGMSNAQASLLTVIPVLLMGLLALPTPWLAHRFGRDRIILLALGVLAVATAARAFAESVGLLLMATVGVGAGIAIVGTLVAGFVKTRFPKHLAPLMGVYAMSLGLGSTIAAGAAGPIAAISGGWRFGSGVFALYGVIAIAAWLVVAHSEKRSSQTDPLQPASKRHALPIRNGTAWLTALYVASNNILFYGLLAWIVPMYRELGLGQTTAGLILASFTTAFMIGNPLPSLVSHTEERRPIIGLFGLIALVGILAIAIAPHFLPFVFVPMVACGVGGSFSLGLTLPLDHAQSPNEANAWNAFVMGIGYFAGALGPFAVGVLRDATGGFEVPIWSLASVGFLMLSLTPFLGPRNHGKAKPGIGF